MHWKRVVMPAAACLLVYGIMAASVDSPPPSRREPPAPNSTPRPQRAPSLIGKRGVQSILSGTNLLNVEESRFQIQQGGSCFTVQSTVDPGLQAALMQRLDRKNSRFIGIVVMDPADGRILAMAGYDRSNPDGNPCLDNRFPAASVFKIITAAAAVETCDLDPASVLNFDGGKYTLYRSQISAKSSKHASRITLRDSFAQSVNPVFGKLGAHALGKDVIESYAEAFGFNREFDFELPLRPSRIELPDHAFGLAEVASGYNRTTRISPLHGAIMAAAVVNNGRLVEPTIVDWVLNDAGQAIYQSQAALQGQVVDPQTARVLRQLMQATVESGTARREFHKHDGDKLLARLEIGGKTGSIGDGTPDRMYDWFVGYARDRHGPGRLVFSVVVAHEDYIGTRAAAYASTAIHEYFRSHVARAETPAATAPRS
jgi:cell division protein FtsI/penicillin-binding protein 2